MLTIVSGQLVAALGVIVGIRIITEVITPTVYGQAKLTWGLVALCNGIFFSPFINYAMRAFPESVKKKMQKTFIGFSRHSIILLFSITAIPFAAGLFVYQANINQFNFPILVLAVALLGLMGLWNLERSFLLADRLQGRVSIIVILESWCIPLAIICTVVILGESISSYFIGGICFYLVGLGLYYWLGTPNYPANEKTDFPDKVVEWRKDAWAFSLPLAFLGLVSWGMGNGNKYILDWLEKPEKVGQFIVCFALASQPFSMLGGIVARFFRPIWYDAVEQGRFKRVRKIMILYFFAVASISGLGIFLLYLFGEEIVQLVLAEPYRKGAISIMLWVAGGYAILVTGGVFEIAMHADKRTGTLATAYSLGMSANLVLSFILIMDRGIVGAAQATFYGFIVYFLLLVLFYFLGRSRQLRYA